MFLQLLHFFDQSLGPTVRRGLEAAILGWVWSYAQCVGNVWLTVFACDDVGRTNSARVAGFPIRSSGRSF